MYPNQTGDIHVTCHECQASCYSYMTHCCADDCRADNALLN
ncbi:hypothetical protein ABLT40_05905 [Acinetobacter schindleri]